MAPTQQHLSPGSWLPPSPWGPPPPRATSRTKKPRPPELKLAAPKLGQPTVMHTVTIEQEYTSSETGLRPQSVAASVVFGSNSGVEGGAAEATATTTAGDGVRASAVAGGGRKNAISRYSTYTQMSVRELEDDENIVWTEGGDLAESLTPTYTTFYPSSPATAGSTINSAPPQQPSAFSELWSPRLPPSPAATASSTSTLEPSHLPTDPSPWHLVDSGGPSVPTTNLSTPLALLQPSPRILPKVDARATDQPKQIVRSRSASDFFRRKPKKKKGTDGKGKRAVRENTSRAAFTIYGAILISFLCACANGYDGSLMNAINGMQAYEDRFSHSQVGSTTGLIFAMYTVGNMVGALFAGPLTDRWGRRVGMFVGCVIIIIGSVVATSARHRPQFIGGRFVLGFGIASVTTAAPAYCIEIAPPAWRGRATGLYNCGWFGGSIPAAAITLGTSYIKNDAAWRIPIMLQCVPAIVVCLCVFFLPESPRWLLAHGRDEEAKAFLIKYHGNGDPHNPLVDLEWVEFKEDIQASRVRFFTLVVLMMGVFGQFSGNGLGYFNLTIYSYVGYGTIMQFVMNLLNSITSAIGAGIGLALNAGFTNAWAKESDSNHNLSIGRAAIASYFFFNIIFSFAYTPLQALYPSECLQTNARAKGMAFYAFAVSAVGFINTYAIPISLQNIKYNTVWIFVGWDLVETVLWYFLCIETQGRTLEELDEIFSSDHPVAASKAVKKIVIEQVSGTVLVEAEK
ncbi:general substrate transporter [Pseudohyphozyma bogoriensis]|nr:general substrate transporter [Pseudohyphozyma bogoriensis]